MTLPYLDVRINGKVNRDIGPALDRVDVDLTMDGPSSLIATWRIASSRVKAKVGDDIEVQVIDENAKRKLFKGVVTSLQVGYTNRGTTTTVVAQDALFTLARGRHSRCWVNETPVAAARSILSSTGLAVDADSLSTVHDIIVQYQETDLAFVQRLGREIGYALWVDDGKVHFKKYKAPTSAAVTLEPDDVLRLNVGENISQQVSSVEVHYWDPQAKAARVAKDTVTRPAASDKGLSATSDHVFGWPVPTDAAARDLASGLGVVVGAAHKTMQAVLPGSGLIRAGVAVALDKIDDAVDGKYLITRARHRYDPERGYEVDVDSAPYRDLSLSGVTSGTRSDSHGGAVTALVTSIKDPEAQGRVQIELPWTEPAIKAWARVSLPGAGTKRGLNIMPEVNDEVFVMFEHQDLRRPVVMGGAYNGKDKSSTVTTKDESVLARTWYSRTGHSLVLDDDKGTAGIRVETANGKNVVRLKEKDGAIEIIADKGGISLTTSTGDLTLKGKNIKIEASAKCDLSAQGGMKVSTNGKLDMSGTAGGSLKSPAIVEIKGSLLKLN